ncbi:TerB family tellurite resistance protein [Oceanispirochaeta sp.]|uniref:TerB family tellurite resistance protein n=1 Tax=Oceanispirochaeta sp. TaxID=2035350 RepID=UPI00262D3312|nr:TerB family tellurite resistance protein [Oceanispirochaeta sp.]MDA3955598.1 TerB family tellurite resistance protein [Oceanispirochaeta sp.]
MSGSRGFIGGVIGFILGLMSGLPFMGIIGAVIGSSIGRSLSFQSGSSRQYNFFQGRSGGMGQQSYSGALNSGQVFFSSVFSMLGKLSIADGSISESEKNTISNFMRTDLRLDPVSQQSAMDIFNAAIRSGNSFESYARQFYQSFAGNAQFTELVLDILLRVAASDGKIHREEERLIQEAVGIFGYSQTSYDRLKSRYGLGGSGAAGMGGASTSSASYGILGCSPSDEDDVIRKAYRKKVSEFHPDKISAKGLPEEFTKFANERFNEIQQAWDSIRKERNLR